MRVRLRRQLRVGVPEQALEVDEADAGTRVPRGGAVTQRVDVELHPLLVQSGDPGALEQPIEDPHDVVRRLAPDSALRSQEDAVAGDGVAAEREAVDRTQAGEIAGES